MTTDDITVTLLSEQYHIRVQKPRSRARNVSRVTVVLENLWSTDVIPLNARKFYVFLFKTLTP